MITKFFFMHFALSFSLKAFRNWLKIFLFVEQFQTLRLVLHSQICSPRTVDAIYLNIMVRKMENHHCVCPLLLLFTPSKVNMEEKSIMSSMAYLIHFLCYQTDCQPEKFSINRQSFQ